MLFAEGLNQPVTIKSNEKVGKEPVIAKKQCKICN